VNSLRRGFRDSTTSMARLWRRKPWMKQLGLRELELGDDVRVGLWAWRLREGD